MEKITIVDKNNNIIGSKPKDKVLTDDIYRVSSLWIENNSNKVLLVQRAFAKNNNPGKWMPVAVAGTVAEGESYEENVIKETMEEIGLDLSKFEYKLILSIFKDGRHKFFLQVFGIKADIEISDLTLDKHEIASIKWFDKNELKELILTKPQMFVPETAQTTEGLL